MKRQFCGLEFLIWEYTQKLIIKPLAVWAYQIHNFLLNDILVFIFSLVFCILRLFLACDDNFNILADFSEICINDLIVTHTEAMDFILCRLFCVCLLSCCLKSMITFWNVCLDCLIIYDKPSPVFEVCSMSECSQIKFKMMLCWNVENICRITEAVLFQN